MAERIDSQKPTIRLKMQGISNCFGATTAIEDISIEVAPRRVKKWSRYDSLPELVLYGILTKALADLGPIS